MVAINDLGARLREFREKKGFTQAAFAAKVNIELNYISTIESGELFLPNDEVLNKIVDTINVDKDELLPSTEWTCSEARDILLNNRNILNSP